MDQKTSEKIIDFIRGKGQASGNELANVLGITTRAVRKQLANLLKQDILYKNGTPPKVYYYIRNPKKDVDPKIVFDEETRNIINENFLLITPSGERKEGVSAFVEWCNTRKENPV